MLPSLLSLVLAAPTAFAPPVELGTVGWTTDLEAAQESSSQSGKPIFMLFQEVPGCHGCVEFGKGPLSHPLLVEAIEDAFVPVSVNNRGKSSFDKKMLDRFDEPYLNYPVVRLLDEQAADIIERRDKVYSNGALSARMVEAIETHSGEAPPYLHLFALEHAERELATATFQMHCYWEGEAHLGVVDGVVGVRSGWAGGAEIVTVTYDASVVGADALEREASAHSCKAVEANTSRDAKASDQSFALRRTTYRYVPMTEG